MQEHSQFSGATVRWLADAEYIWLDSPARLDGKYTARLSPKGMEILRAIPDSLEEKIPLGEKIVEFSKKDRDNFFNRLSEACAGIWSQVFDKCHLTNYGWGPPNQGNRKGCGYNYYITWRAGESCDYLIERQELR